MKISAQLFSLLLILSFTLASPLAHAESSWFDKALDMIGLGGDAPAVEKQAPVAEKQNTTSQSAAGTVKAAPDSATATITKMAADQAIEMLPSLTSMVTGQLGVSEPTANGGLGTLFSLAQKTLGSSEFSSLSALVPEMDSLLKAAPEVSEKAKGLTSLMGNAGKYANVLQGATTAYAQFKTLGISAEQIPAYIQVTEEFLKSKGGADAVLLFDKGVNSLLAPAS